MLSQWLPARPGLAPSAPAGRPPPPAMTSTPTPGHDPARPGLTRPAGYCPANAHSRAAASMPQRCSSFVAPGLPDARYPAGNSAGSSLVAARRGMAVATCTIEGAECYSHALPNNVRPARIEPGQQRIKAGLLHLECIVRIQRRTRIRIPWLAWIRVSAANEITCQGLRPAWNEPKAATGDDSRETTLV
jgi:hypothetical protein